jgi:hypothetical protein
MCCVAAKGVVKMPNAFTDEHPDMQFICGFCNGNGRVAVGEYQQQQPLHKTFENIHRIPRDHGSSRPVNAEYKHYGQTNVLASVQ